MKDLYPFYEDRIIAFSKKLDLLKKKIHLTGSIRLLIVVAALVTLWLLRNDGVWLLAGITAGYLVPFLILLIYHNKLFHQKEYTETLITFNRNELKALNYDFSAFDGAKEMTNPEHSFGLDLDLFGERSLFQSINRTITESGKTQLANWLIHPLDNRRDILRRQEAVKELTELTELRHHFYVTGSLFQNSDTSETIYRQLNVPSIFINHKIWNILQYAIPGCWIAGVALVCFNILPSLLLSWLFLLCIFISYSKIKSVTKLHNSVDKLVKILSSYASLARAIENQPFQTEELKDILSLLTNGKQKTSEVIGQLSKHLNALDQRYNWFFGLFLNAFYLWDIRQCIRIEKWKEAHALNSEKWFTALTRFDALSSLGGFAYNHPEYSYPEIAEKYFCMEGKALGHPLLHRDVCIKNDINIEKSPWFLIITGANMAGKSTYLRTIGVNYLLACTGVPVCAEYLKIYPAHLVTSLRTADSLADNESYFFAELKRLKMIIDRLAQGEQLFIILDEILKGTNSVDKQKGSLALIKQLISRRACGIIATHDLMLGSLEKEFPKEVKNYRFEADITNNELTFSYQLREGIAQNMNACFLMKKMGIDNIEL